MHEGTKSGFENNSRFFLQSVSKRLLVWASEAIPPETIPTMNKENNQSVVSNAPQHTPGPWTVVTRQIQGQDYCQPVIINAEPSLDVDDIANVIVPDTQRDGGRDGLVAMANARLIAAAPELLAVCRALVDAPGTGRTLMSVIEQAEIALTKAEGRS